MSVGFIREHIWKSVNFRLKCHYVTASLFPVYDMCILTQLWLNSFCCCAFCVLFCIVIIAPLIFADVQGGPKSTPPPYTEKLSYPIKTRR